MAEQEWSTVESKRCVRKSKQDTKKIKHEEEPSCFFFQECKNACALEGGTYWPYCTDCYKNKCAPCENKKCKEQVYLQSSKVGEYHKRCKLCRAVKK